MSNKLITERPGARFDIYRKWDELQNAPYDYVNDGLNQHILTNKLMNITNPITQFMLDVYESTIVFVLRYVDELKNFKNVHWKNR